MRLRSLPAIFLLSASSLGQGGLDREAMLREELAEGHLELDHLRRLQRDATDIERLRKASTGLEGYFAVVNKAKAELAQGRRWLNNRRRDRDRVRAELDALVLGSRQRPGARVAFDPWSVFRLLSRLDSEISGERQMRLRGLRQRYEQLESEIAAEEARLAALRARIKRMENDPGPVLQRQGGGRVRAGSTRFDFEWEHREIKNRIRAAESVSDSVPAQIDYLSRWLAQTQADLLRLRPDLGRTPPDSRREPPSPPIPGPVLGAEPLEQVEVESTPPGRIITPLPDDWPTLPDPSGPETDSTQPSGPADGPDQAGTRIYQGHTPQSEHVQFRRAVELAAAKDKWKTTVEHVYVSPLTLVVWSENDGPWAKIEDFMVIVKARGSRPEDKRFLRGSFLETATLTSTFRIVSVGRTGEIRATSSGWMEIEGTENGKWTTRRTPLEGTIIRLVPRGKGPDFYELFVKGEKESQMKLMPARRDAVDRAPSSPPTRRRNRR